MNIGANLKQIRLSLGKTQKEVCDICGFKQGYYTGWENNKYIPGADSLIKLANYFGCSVDYLLNNKSEDESTNICNKINIGTNIKQLRLSLGKTQKEIAEQGGFRQGIYANWENNRFLPGADSLIKLADCFGCSVDYILGRESEDGNIILSNNITNSTIPQNIAVIDFAERLKTIRKKNNLTQNELALKSNISRSNINTWETGRSLPLPDGLIALSNALECSIDYLLGKVSEDDTIIQNNNITNFTLPKYKIEINFAERLKTIRKENGMTQMQVSEKSGLSQSNINTWERGRSLPLPDGLIALANCFNCSIDYLLGRDARNEAIIINLTQEEESLLQYFRQINKETRQTIIKMLKGIIDNNI